MGTRTTKDKKNKIVACLVLDESGSMYAVKNATIEGVNSFLDEARDRDDAEVFISLTKFNSAGVKVMHEAEPVSSIPHLTKISYTPAGGTPLFDAIAEAVLATEKQLSKWKERPKLLCVVQTDGEENASKTYKTKEKIRAFIKSKEGDGWLFVYLGANQDAFSEGSSIGIAGKHTMTYLHTTAGYKESWASVGIAAMAYAGSSAKGSADYDFFAGITSSDHTQVGMDQVKPTPKPTKKTV